MSTSRLKRWSEGYVRSSFERPWRVVVAVALLLLVAGALAARLPFRGSFVELLPGGAREVQDLATVSAKAGGDGYLVVRARGAEPAELREYAGRLAARLEGLPEVRYVEHRFDVGFLRQQALWLLPLETLGALRRDVEARVRYEKQQANPFFIELRKREPPASFEELERRYAGQGSLKEYLASADGREAYLLVKPAATAGDLEFARRLVDTTAALAREEARAFPGVVTDMTGAFQNRLEEDALMRRDLARASLLSALLAVGLILLATRRLAALVVVGLPVVVGVTLTFAVAYLTVGHLNVVTGFLVAILIGLGLEYGVHLAMRYWEERRGLPAREAMVAAVGGTFGGALTSAATNAAAFLVLLLAQFHAFRQFGFIAAVGVLLAMLAAYALGPALLAIAERIRPAHPPAASGACAPAAALRPQRRFRLAPVAAVLLGVLGFAGFSALVVPRLGFESDLRKLKGDSPASRLDDHITQQLGSPLNPAILYVDGLEQAATVQQVVAEVKERHAGASALLGSVSLNDLLPRDVEQHREEIGRLRVLFDGLPDEVRGEARLAPLRAMLEATPHTLADLPQEVRRRFEALDGNGLFLLLLPAVSNYDTRELETWAAQIDEVVAGAQARGVSLAVLDSNRIASRIFALVRSDGPLILWAAALVVFAVILASLRSLRRALLVAGPLFLGMTCLAGLMHLSGVKLNFLNAVVLPNLLAIAVDNSVHLYHRYREEGFGSLRHVVRHTGLAAVVATLSNAAGYAALLVAGHQGLRSIGQLALLGVMATFLGTTVFFPALLALLERMGGRGAGRQGAMVHQLELPVAPDAAAEQKSA